MDNEKPLRQSSLRYTTLPAYATMRTYKLKLQIDNYPLTTRNHNLEVMLMENQTRQKIFP
jgi:hypothetical protein